MDNKEINVGHILKWMFDDAVEHAPEPQVDWFRQQLAAQTAQREQRARVALRERFASLRKQLERVKAWRPLLTVWPARWDPELAPVYRGYTESGHAETDDEPIVEDVEPTGVIPARVLYENDEVGEAWFEAMHKPIVAGDNLILSGRIVGRNLDSKATLEMTLITAEGELVEPATTLKPGKEVALDIELPSTLRQDWQGIKNWDWEQLPIRFILRPHDVSSDDRTTAQAA